MSKSQGKGLGCIASNLKVINYEFNKSQGGGLCCIVRNLKVPKINRAAPKNMAPKKAPPKRAAS